jgi:hypothetical protein
VVEILGEQLADFDPSSVADTNKCAWFGVENFLPVIFETLGFSAAEIQGVIGTLKTQRGAARRLDVPPAQLHARDLRKPLKAKGAS